MSMLQKAVKERAVRDDCTRADASWICECLQAIPFGITHNKPGYLNLPYECLTCRKTGKTKEATRCSTRSRWPLHKRFTSVHPKLKVARPVQRPNQEDSDPAISRS